MRALIITGSGVQDQEFIYPYYRLQEAGYEVTVAADGPEFAGIKGGTFSANASLQDEAEVVEDYEMLVIPGGVKCVEKLLLSQAVVHIVCQYRKQKKDGVIAAICSGVQMLIQADLVRGRRAAIYPAFRKFLENAGGKFVDMPAVVD